VTTRLNWLDRAISFVNPQAGASRMRARLIEKNLSGSLQKRRYEGASTGRRTDGWLTTGNSANAEVGPAMHKLRGRSRDLVRNNPYANRAVSVIAANVIGTGILTQPVSENAKQAAKAFDLWRKWADTTDCDADEKHDLYGLQNLIMRTVVESGECLIRRRRRRLTDGYAVPIQLQVMEPDFLDLSRDGVIETGRIYQGVEYDLLGKRVAYWLFPDHPGELVPIKGMNLRSQRVLASEILHVYRMDRPGQIRGVPWAAPVMIKLRDFDDLEDAQLLRQKIAACFTAFVKDMEMGSDLTDTKTNVGDKIEPGLIEQLPPGKEITFANPPGVTGYAEYSSAILHSIAAGFGVTYESLTGDLSQVNYSSGRMGWLEFQRNIEAWRWQLLIPNFCGPVWEWFLEAAVLMGLKTDGLQARHTPPRREMIDPTKEVPALRDAIRAGLITLPEVQRQQGYDPDALLSEYQKSNEALDKFGVILDCDPRKISRAGTPAVAMQNGSGGGTNEQ
jgi:lambda family phage portal protein